MPTIDTGVMKRSIIICERTDIMANNVLRMKELIKKIAEADQAYFRDDKPIMTDREYDAMMEELKKLETETGVIFAGSPSQKVSGETKKGLEQVRHSKPMLSANKTKAFQEFVDFARSQDVVLSWKLDGLPWCCATKRGVSNRRSPGAAKAWWGKM